MEWNPIFIEEQIRIESLYSFFCEKLKKGFDFPGEIHDFWECRYILKGSICISGDDMVYELNEGDLIFHKPMELHKFYIDNEPGAEICIFSLGLKGPLTEYFKGKVFHLTSEQRDIIEKLLAYANSKPVSHSLKKEEQFLIYGKEHPVYLQRVSNYIYELLLSLGESGNTSEISSAPDALLFKKTVNYMKDKIYEHPSVSDIARHFYLSDSGLKRLFLKYAGIGVHKYFLKLKFKVAAKLLEDGLSVSEVSEKLNFSSQSYFSVSFKREFGVSPSVFTKQ